MDSPTRSFARRQAARARRDADRASYQRLLERFGITDELRQTVDREAREMSLAFNSNDVEMWAADVNIELLKSGIHGVGVYIMQTVPEEHVIGTHTTKDGLLTMALGAMLNHAERPNCYLDFYQRDPDCVLVISRMPIYAWEELTINYDSIFERIHRRPA